jgi:hypothetical protein
MGKTKDLSAFEWGRVLSAMCTGLSVSRTATLLDFSHSTVYSVYKEWSTTQRPSNKLEETKLLGVTLDCKGSWSKHIYATVAKMRRGLSVIK